jgi:DNA (cytosine-5)-methyltransferase 1
MKKIRVVELFAGVGGFRLGLEGWKGKSASTHYKKTFTSGYQVVWSNQWEPSSTRLGEKQEANMVYHKNWPNTSDSLHYPHDLGAVASPEMTDQQVKKNIPDHDLLVGGFPCQDYSVAGVNAKGLEGKKGVLWWNIHKLLKAKRPKFLFLENVDRLLKSPTSERGRDFAIMLSTLWNLGYVVEWKAINAADYGMPQRRRRVYILAYHSGSNIKVADLKDWTLEKGVFASTFPGRQIGSERMFNLSKDPMEVTKNYNEGKFLNSGVMKDGKVWMCDFKADITPKEMEDYSKEYRVLNDVLANHLNGELKEYIVDSNKRLKTPLFKPQKVDFKIDERLKKDGNVAILETELDKWIYLKGKKAEMRVSSKGEFYYTEGPLSLTDDLYKPSRTIITSEGGTGASRFKHLITIDGQYRRLHPIELERLNMFPDDHTKMGNDGEQDVVVSAAKRAFFMGNALVIGVVEKVGVELYKRYIK